MISPKPWRLEAVLQLLLWLLLSLALGGSLIALLTPRTEVAQLGFLQITIGTLSFHGALLWLIHLFVRAHGTDWVPAFGFANGNRQRALGLGFLVAVGVLPIAMWLGGVSAEVMRYFQVEPVAQASVQTLQANVALWEKAYLGALAICVAPLAEELLFRGILYPAIKQKGYPRFALWGTAVFFAFAHANLMTFVPLLFLSLALVWLYETTDNLLAPILAHSLFNAFNFVYLINGGATGV